MPRLPKIAEIGRADHHRFLGWLLLMSSLLMIEGFSIVNSGNFGDSGNPAPPFPKPVSSGIISA
jgi:hypothetical protein